MSKKLTEDDKGSLYAAENDREQEIILLLPALNKFIFAYRAKRDKEAKGWLPRIRHKLDRIEKTLQL